MTTKEINNMTLEQINELRQSRDHAHHASRIKFICSYQGESTYQDKKTGERYALRFHRIDWRPDVWNYTEEEIETKLNSQMGIFRREYSKKPVPDDVFADFVTNHTPYMTIQNPVKS